MSLSISSLLLKSDPAEGFGKNFLISYPFCITTPLDFLRKSSDGRGMEYEIKSFCSYLGIYFQVKNNLDSNFLLSNSISKLMIKKKWGRIINITSIVGHTGNLGQANYVASKSGITGMTKSIAMELAKWNITVNCVSPGFIKTNMTERLNE